MWELHGEYFSNTKISPPPYTKPIRIFDRATSGGLGWGTGSPKPGLRGTKHNTPLVGSDNTRTLFCRMTYFTTPLSMGGHRISDDTSRCVQHGYARQCRWFRLQCQRRPAPRRTLLYFLPPSEVHATEVKTWKCGIAWVFCFFALLYTLRCRRQESKLESVALPEFFAFLLRECSLWIWTYPVQHYYRVFTVLLPQ